MKRRITLYSIDDLETVEDYEEIVCIRTNSYYNSKNFGDLISKCINLEELYFLESFFKVTIPLTILKLPKLRSLVFKGVEFEEVLPLLGQLKSLKILGLQEHFLPTLPFSLTELPILEELDFDNTQFGKNLSSWGLLKDIKTLKHLNLLRSKLDQLPIEIIQQEQLYELALPKKYYNQLIKKHPVFCNRIPYFYSHTALEKKYYYNLLNICRKNNFNWSFRIILMNLLAGNEEKLNTLATQEAILKATDIKQLEVIRLKALEYYSKRWTAVLTPDSQLAVVGKLSTNKRELQKKLKVQGIKYSSKVTDETTHLLLGQLSNKAYEKPLQNKLPILTEQQVLTFINEHSEQYLVDDVPAEDGQTEHIGQLLLSDQNENILLALMLFKQGGFPKELLTELFIVHKQTEDSVIQREVERLIRQYASIGLVDELKKNRAIFSNYASEIGIKRKLKSLEKHLELDCLKIAWYGYHRYKKGITYLLKALSKERSIQLLKQLIKEEQLSLAHIGLTTVPPAVFELSELKVLDLSYNYQLRTISLKLLKKLHQLNLLIIKGNYHLKENYLILEKIKEQMPNLKIHL